MSNIHILAVPFTGLGIPGFRGNKWLKHRLEVFKRFVLPSLRAQTRQDFTVWCQWRPEEESNHLVREFMSQMDGMRGMRFVHTFHGVTLWDDKYADSEASARLMRSLSLSLPKLKDTVGDSDWVYLTCQPSDDCYKRTAFERIRENKPEKSLALAFTEGYAVNYGNMEVRDYDPDTLPPFATVVFPKDVFLNPSLHYTYVGPYVSHEHLGDALKVRRLGGRMFMVGTHGGNISTTFNHPYCKNPVRGRERFKVINSFGLHQADPLPSYRGIRLWLRVFANCLPKPLHDILRYQYNRLRAKYYGRFK